MTRETVTAISIVQARWGPHSNIGDPHNHLDELRRRKPGNSPHRDPGGLFVVLVTIFMIIICGTAGVFIGDIVGGTIGASFGFFIGVSAGWIIGPRIGRLIQNTLR